MFALRWLGRSCFELTVHDRARVLFDPFLDRYKERFLAPFSPPDVICVSHGHLDHFADVPELVRGDSSALVVAIPRLCRALGELFPETKPRLCPIAWGEHVELLGMRFSAFPSPSMQTSLFDMFQEFGVRNVLDFLRAFRQLADNILYLPLTSFGLKVNDLRTLHFVSEGETSGQAWTAADVIGAFSPQVALVSVEHGHEQRSAEYAAELGAPTIIPHHYEASGSWPAADLDRFARELNRLAPETTLRIPDLMETISL